MKREILFRGKRIDNGEWVEGYLFVSKGGGHYILDTNNDGDNGYQVRFILVGHETVGQFTGLTDKNGKKIFDGDIFKFSDEVFESYCTSCGTEYDSWEVENYGVVGFCDYSGRFDFVKYKYSENLVEADLHENHSIEFYDFVSELEVIWNIYDNPELLKDGE